MKIEYFPPTEHERPVILIYGNEPECMIALRKRVASLATGSLARVVVHGLPGFEGVDDCQLVFSAATRDLGVRPTGEPSAYECVLRPASWDNVEGLLEPFCEHHASTAFQFLDTSFPSEIGLIVSTDRGW